MRSRVRSAALAGDARFMPALAAALIAGSAVAIWLGDGVRVDEIARFAGYELAYVIGPGWLIYEVLSPGTASRFRRLVIGWALGHVVEVLAFVLTAAVGVRDLFTVYPLAVLLLAAGVSLARRRRSASAVSPSEISAWALRRVPAQIAAPWALATAGVCLLMLAYLVVTWFVSTPLPRDVDQIFYIPDSIFHISLAAEALHHWPLTNPNVSGVPLDYYWFVHAHYAAVSQVTGISLPVVVLALDIVPLVLLLVCQLSLSGALLGRRWAVGPLAALLALMVSEVDLTKPGSADAPFNGSLPSYLTQSPTFLFGAIFFVPLVLLLCERIVSPRQDWRQWLLIGLLAVGCAGSKGPAMPVLAGGLIIYLGVGWLRDRRMDRAPLIGLAVVGPVMLFFLAVLYGNAGGRLHVAIPGAIAQTEPVTTALAHIPDSLAVRVPFWILIVPLSLLFTLVAPLLGLVWLLRERGRSLPPEQMLPLAMLAAGLLAMIVLYDDARGQQFFFMYGLLAAVPISAAGVFLFFSKWHAEPDASRGRAIGFSALWSAALAVLVFVVGFKVFVHHDLIPVGYLALYVPTTLAVIGLWLRAARAPQWMRQQRAMYAVLAILIAAGLNAPLDYVPSVTDLWAAGKPLYSTAEGGLTAPVRDDLGWVREHTDDDAVLATNPSTAPLGPAGPALYFYVAALTERHVLLEGWSFTPQAGRLGFVDVVDKGLQPFPGRLRLERLAVDKANPGAIATLVSDYGVTDLLVEKDYADASPLLRRRAMLVHSGKAFDVYELPTSAGQHQEGLPVSRPASRATGRSSSRSTAARWSGSSRGSSTPRRRGSRARPP